MPEVEIKNPKVEKHKGQGQCNQGAYDDDFHGQVALGTCRLRFFRSLFPAEFLFGHSQSRFDGTRGFYYPDDPGHCNAADPDVSGITGKDLLGAHLAYGLQNSASHQVNDLFSPDEVHQRDDTEPGQKRPAANDESVFQADDISQSEDCGTDVQFSHQFGLIGKGNSPGDHPGSENFAPPSERGDDEIVKAAYQAADEQVAGAFATRFPAYQYLCGGGGFREREFSVHIFYKIFPERYYEKDPQYASQE